RPWALASLRWLQVGDMENLLAPHGAKAPHAPQPLRRTSPRTHERSAPPVLFSDAACAKVASPAAGAWPPPLLSSVRLDGRPSRLGPEPSKGFPPHRRATSPRPCPCARAPVSPASSPPASHRVCSAPASSPATWAPPASAH